MKESRDKMSFSRLGRANAQEIRTWILTAWFLLGIISLLFILLHFITINYCYTIYSYFGLVNIIIISKKEDTKGRTYIFKGLAEEEIELERG